VFCLSKITKNDMSATFALKSTFCKPCFVQLIFYLTPDFQVSDSNVSISNTNKTESWRFCMATMLCFCMSHKYSLKDTHFSKTHFNAPVRNYELGCVTDAASSNTKFCTALIRPSRCTKIGYYARGAQYGSQQLFFCSSARGSGRYWK